MICLFHFVAFFLLSFLHLSRCDGNDKSFVERNYKTVQEIYNLVLYPNNAPIVQALSNAVPKGLLDDNVIGRVTPLGNFIGLNDSIEYFFVLGFPTPPVFIGFSNVTIAEFATGCPQVAASTIYLTTSRFIPQNEQFGVTTLKEMAYWNFDKHGAVINYDAWLPNLAAWIGIAQGEDPNSPAFQQGTIQNICQTQDQRCVGANKQYSSVDECVAILSSKPFGHYDEAWGDNVACRSIHVLLTVTRPDVHCQHVGPTGGGKCVDTPYEQKYFGDAALFGKPAKEIFNCDAYR